MGRKERTKDLDEKVLWIYLRSSERKALSRRIPISCEIQNQANFSKMAPKRKAGSGITRQMKLSDDLADIVGHKQASRAELMKYLWTYIKSNNLQDPDNKQFFTPDPKMAKVFGKGKIRCFSMAEYLGKHLTPLE